MGTGTTPSSDKGFAEPPGDPPGIDPKTMMALTFTARLPGPTHLCPTFPNINLEAFSVLWRLALRHPPTIFPTLALLK